MDPEGEWKALESRVEDPTPYLSDMERLHRDYYPRVNCALIARMERLVRAIAMQFTLGGHADPVGEIRKLSVVYTKFRNLRDHQFGTVDYRRSVEILRVNADQWIRRSDQEIAESGWPSLAVSKAEFGDEWPFRNDRVTVECRDGLFYIVNIGGYDFALNGMRRGAGSGCHLRTTRAWRCWGSRWDRSLRWHTDCRHDRVEVEMFRLWLILTCCTLAPDFEAKAWGNESRRLSDE